MPIDLRTLQSHFSAFVLEGDDNIKQQIVSSEILKSDLRLAIYANAYVARLVEALETDYPVLSHLLGEEQFFDLATDYCRAHPSTRPSLRWFGHQLVSFMRAQPAYAQAAYLIEIAELEWSLATAFNAADADAVSEADVATIPMEKWPELTLGFHPSLQLLSYHWNIIALWNAVKDDTDIPAAQKLAGPERCVVWRAGLKTCFRTLEALERSVLPMMLEGMSFGELCQLIAEQGTEPEQVPMQAAGLLKTWINNGFVTELRYP